MITQSAELSQREKQCVLAKTIFWNLDSTFSFLYSTLFRYDSTFWLDSTLKLYCESVNYSRIQ